MKTSSITHASLLIVGSAISATAFGSGFALNEQSARTLGQAYAGRVSDADNSATLMLNPAGMSRLKGAEISLGFSFIDASSDISDVSSTAAFSNVPGTNDGDMIPFSTVPFGYYVQPIDDHWTAGIGIYVPFGLTTDYEHNFQGRYFGNKSEIRNITVQPTVSYRFDNGLSLGLGITYNRIDGELSEAIFNPVPPHADINAKVQGDDTAWGYNLGMLYEFSPHTRIGLTYYSKVDYKLDGHTDLTDVPAQLGVGSSVRYDAALEIETPDRIDLGITHDLTPELTLHGDITRTDWTTLNELKVTNKGAPALVAQSVEPLDWDATMFYSLGLSYKIDAQWVIRGGIGYDKQPMPNSTLSVRLPAGDRKMFALGTTWSPLSNLDIDASFMYIEEDTVRVNQTTQTLVGNYPITYSAKFDNSVSLFSLQASWKF